MRKLIILVMISSGYGQTGGSRTVTPTSDASYIGIIEFKKVDVKKLTDTQKKAIREAEKGVEEAKEKYNKVVRGINAAHGVVRYTGRNTTTGCNPLVMSAEILNNEWIVIKTEALNNCVFTVDENVEPIK